MAVEGNVKPCDPHTLVQSVPLGPSARGLRSALCSRLSPVEAPVARTETDFHPCFGEREPRIPEHLRPAGSAAVLCSHPRLPRLFQRQHFATELEEVTDAVDGDSLPGLHMCGVSGPRVEEADIEATVAHFGD